MARNNLIFSRRNDDGILNSYDIATRAPAVFALDHSPELSTRYADIRTSQAIEILQDYGWQVTQALQKRSKKPTGIDHASHMVSFANVRNGDVREGSERPEIVLYNSHDGSSSLRLFAGLYRFICSNGIIAGAGFQSILRHTSGGASGFERAIRESVEFMPTMLATIERMKSVRLDHDAMITLASKSLSLRWERLPIDSEFEKGIAPGAYFDARAIAATLDPIRSEDTLPDAWTVFNRIQESVMRGKTLIASIQHKGDQITGKYRHARPVTGVSEVIRVNRGLWDLARDVAEV